MVTDIPLAAREIAKPLLSVSLKTVRQTLWIGFKMKTIQLLVAVLICLPSISRAQEMPQNPKSEADCDAWGRQFQANNSDKLVVAGANDARCKQNYSGSFIKVYELCPNVNSARVEHLQPCGQGEYYSKCYAIQLEQNMQICRQRVASEKDDNLDPRKSSNKQTTVSPKSSTVPGNTSSAKSGSPVQGSEKSPLESDLASRLKKANEKDIVKKPNEKFSDNQGNPSAFEEIDRIAEKQKESAAKAVADQAKADQAKIDKDRDDRVMQNARNWKCFDQWTQCRGACYREDLKKTPEMCSCEETMGRYCYNAQLSVQPPVRAQSCKAYEYWRNTLANFPPGAPERAYNCDVLQKGQRQAGHNPPCSCDE
jgi:hypothetical protein